MINKYLSAVISLVLSGQTFASEPLLIEGSNSLYQRVLTTPECLMKTSPSDKKGKPIPAFSRYYVYEISGDQLRVGPDTTGQKLSGWLEKSCTVDWRIQTSLMFTNPSERNVTPILDNKEYLLSLLESPDINSSAKPLIDAAKNNKNHGHLISAEPNKYIDYHNQFYLLPILNFEETMFDDGNYVRAVEVASLTSGGQNKNNSSNNDQTAIKGYTAAVVFLIDSSISMQPYLDRTKKTLLTVYKNIEDSMLNNNIKFGLIAFRSNLDKTPGLEYNTKVFVRPGEANSIKEFEDKLKNLKQAKVSSVLFDEDAYGGVNAAISEIDWSSYGGKYIILITDAGAIEGSSKYSTTGMNSSELRIMAKEKGIALITLHIKTPAGSKNHRKAQEQYHDLSMNHAIAQTLYYEVPAGDVDKLGKETDKIASFIVEEIKQTLRGNLAAGSAMSATGDSLSDDLNRASKAMQLAYLGSVQGTKAPSFFKGWIADHDLLKHSMPTSEPVVLLTKMQLSDLKDITQKIIDTTNEGMLDPDQMFSQLRSIAASLGRDPNKMKEAKTLKISEMGLLGEYLDGLPYKSRIQELDEESWSAMGPDEQNLLIESLESKLAFYQKCNEDVDNWINLTEGEDPSEAVYPVPLEVLP